MDITPNLELPFILPSQAQKHVTHNEALRRLDAVVHLAVAGRDLASPPAEPEDGERHIVAADAAGEWTGHTGQIAAFARKGIKTIVNLRGGREHGSWPLQKEACERHGIALVDFVLRSRGAPDRETILGAKAFFAGLREPALVHCKSGADRAGFFSVLYLLVHENRPLDEAIRQLSLRYGHFRFAKTGILDAFFEAYRREGEARGIAFLDWVATGYDPERLEREFKPGLLSSLIADRLIRRE